MEGSFSDLVGEVSGHEPTTGGDTAKQAYWFDWFPFLNAVAGSQQLSDNNYETAFAGTYAATTMADQSVLEFRGGDLFTGTEGNDTLTGTVNDDYLRGGLGDDSLAGDTGEDTYLYNLGDGHDTIVSAADSGGEQPDRILFGENLTADDLQFSRDVPFRADDLRITLPDGGAIDIRRQFNNGDRRIESFEFDDGNDLTWEDVKTRYLEQNTTDGNDTIIGFSGDDVIEAGPGDDTIDSHRGSDTFLYNLGDGNDSIAAWADYGEAQPDRIVFGDGLAAAHLRFTDDIPFKGDDLRIHLQDGGSIDISKQFGNGTKRIESFEFANGSSLSWEDIEAVIAAQTLGTDSANGLTGSTGDDILFGKGGDDTLEGGDGDDILDGGAGEDRLTGGNGADTFRFFRLTDSLQDGLYDRITDFEVGVDKIDLTGLGFTTLTSNGTTQAGELRLAYSSNSDRTYLRSDQEDFELYLDGDFRGVLTNDDIIFNAALTITGSANADSLIGGDDNESLNGLAGDDTLTGGHGSDTLDGGAGEDKLTGGNGADIFRFSDLTHSLQDGLYDRITDFEVGVDKIDLTGLGFVTLTSNGTTQAGELRLAYSSSSDRTYLRSDQSDFELYLDGDYRTTLTNDDIIFDGTGTDTLTGTSSADNLSGSGLDEVINGLAGDDTLDGGNGNDTLDGGADEDRLTGGNGADIFRFSDLTHSVHTGGYYDRITDFEDGVDMIDLAGLGFTTLTSSGTTQSGELRLAYSSGSDRTYVRSDQVDFEFYLDGDYTAQLDNSDFIFS